MVVGDVEPGQAVLGAGAVAAVGAPAARGHEQAERLGRVEEDGGGVRYSCREWDKSSQTATAATSHVTFDRRLLPDLLFAELLTHFRPLAEVETVDEGGKTLELRVRGGELFPPDPAVLPVATGAYFSPYFRSFDRKGQLQSLQHVPWTYVRVTSVDRGRARGDGGLPAVQPRGPADRLAPGSSPGTLYRGSI